MEEFITNLYVECTSEHNQKEYIKAKIVEAIEKFQLKEEQIPKF
ncbi:hypothetical protein [Niallia nealsonii]|nr:hypothetical protein [Niallia nealsonii]